MNAATETANVLQPHLLPWQATASAAPLPWSLRLEIAFERWRRWEFWPLWLFYLPVLAWIVWLGWRYRNPTLFTAVNPGLEASGLVGEQKHKSLLPLQQVAPDLVATSSLLLPGTLSERCQQVYEFASKSGYPLVLKPDIGQRGRGVFIARTAEQVQQYLERYSAALIVQPYIAGEEYGVFIAQAEGDAVPKIISIVKKSFPSVIGDGESNLWQLILAHPRARLLASFLRQRWAADWQQIPAAGKQIPLVEIGSHCRGSLFEDACALATPELAQTLARVTAGLPGFNFGRLDLRTTDDAALAAGENISIMEVNGVAAESAHIYHPGTSLRLAWKTMFDQWSLAFAIAAEQVKRGAQPMSLRQLIQAAWADHQRDAAWF